MLEDYTYNTANIENIQESFIMKGLRHNRLKHMEDNAMVITVDDEGISQKVVKEHKE